MDIIRFILRLPYRIFCICLEAILYFALFLLIVLRAILWLISPIIGQVNWLIPKWYPRAKDIYQASIKRINNYSSIIGCVVILAIVAYLSGNYAYHWYLNKPKPIEPAHVITNTYGISFYAPEESGVITDPNQSYLKIKFTGHRRSPAPIDKIGKEITEGIEISPEIKGIWSWHDDKNIYFKPEQPWPIGETYTVKLDGSKLLNPNNLISNEDNMFTFKTTGFSFVIISGEFYQNPIDAEEKLGIYEVKFTHPVDPTTFENNLKLSLFQDTNQKYKPHEFVQNVNFTINYNKDKTRAYIKSDKLEFADKNRYLSLNIAKGITSSMGGSPATLESSKDINIPNKYNLNINSTKISFVELSNNEMRQIITINLGYNVKASDLQKALSIWQLPDPDAKYSEEYYDKIDNKHKTKYFIDKTVLDKSKRLTTKYIETDDNRTYQNQFSFEINGDQRQQIFITVDPSLTSEGGYTFKNRYEKLMRISEYSKLLNFAATGSLLSLSGDKKIPVVSRNVNQIKLELKRVIPSQLQHLVYDNESDFNFMNFENYNSDNFVEKYSITKDVKGKSGAIHYSDFDITPYLKKDVKENEANHGVFLLNLYAKKDNVKKGEEPYEYYNSRFILVTDLGIINKKSLDGSYDLFVQSINSGLPVNGAKVSILGANGIEITSSITDNTGHVNFAPLSDYYKGIKPLLFLIEKGKDMSFLPISKGYRYYDRKLNYSRFDVDGQYETVDRGELHAHLFSDRGIYRPGDTFHIGMIIKADDWTKSLNGIKLAANIYDAKNNLVITKKIKVDDYGFNEISFKTEESSPTGQWHVYLYIEDDENDSGNDDQNFLGSTSVTIREFEPDKTKVTAQIVTENKQGWINQSDIIAKVTAKNLFGTAAQDRRVESKLYLQPTRFSFKKYQDYQFYRVGTNRSNFKIELEDNFTNEEGIADIDLHIKDFEGQYVAKFLTDVFEPNSGRSVAAMDSILISASDYLVGAKPDGKLSYIKRDSKRLLNFIAINPTLDQITLDGLKLVTLEKKYLSVLVEQSSGVYKYESKQKDVVISQIPFEIDNKETVYQIPTKTPGNYILQLLNNQNEVIYQTEYSVAGSANVTRSLDRNSELMLKIDANQYKPGQDIEIAITAPYTGSGIITIERDKVYAWKWFKTDTTSSVQKITLPEEVEGNAYINVQFIRDPNSEEIFMSPLSYGVVPFKVSDDKFMEKVKLETPNLIKPGETIPITIKTNSQQRVVVFAVDEGILQVAGYQLKNPIKNFIRKKALSVRTDQILDLILPEYKRLLTLSAPGGDQDSDNKLNAHLNPFKRKTDEPVTYWSGIIDVNGEKQLNYKVPEFFSGKIRVMAVTVGKKTMGVTQTSTTVRNDFVLNPNVPYFVTPNDEFEISLLVANNITEIGNEEIPIEVKLTTTPHLTVLDEPMKTVKLASMKEGTLSFRLKATEQLGSGDLLFTATYKDKTITRQVSTSVRPVNPYRIKTIMGRMDGKTQTFSGFRQMYPEFNEQNAGVSYSPMILVKGLTEYLDDYEYFCSEQIVSRALPLVIGNKYPDFNLITDKTIPFNGVMQKLQSRQNSGGAIGLWYSTYNVDPFITLYTVHFLLEAKDAGLVIPKDLLENANKYVKLVAAGSLTDSYNLRLRAYAIYLLTRQNIITTNQIASIIEDLNHNYKSWTTDLTALYLASSYKMLKMDKQADKLLKPIWKDLSKAYDKAWWSHNYYDPLVIDAGKIYLIAKHFDNKINDIPAQALENMVLMLNEERYTTQSAAMTMLALDSYNSAIKAHELDENDLTVTTKSNDQQAKIATIAKLKNLLANGKFNDSVESISFHNAKNLPAWYSISQKGFDRSMQQEPINRGLEIYREFTDNDGKQIDTVKLGETINVTVRVRSISEEGLTNIAIVDMLPGGFEVVQQKAVNNHAETENDKQSDEDEGENDNYDSEQQWISPIATGKYTWYPDYTDVREDRVIIYGSTRSDQIQTFNYQIKATNIGQYAVPPAYGEAMYDRDIQAVSKGGNKIIIEPR